MMVNGLEEPIGYDFSSLSLSWIVDCDNSNKVADTKVEISLDANFTQLVHNSKYQSKISSLEYMPNITLTPRTRYYWRVSVRTEKESEIINSNFSFFETGKMNEAWKGKWITSSLSQSIPPYFRKTFNLNHDNFHNSRIYICGLGLYELYVNGRKVSKEHFTPYCTGYKYWLQYQTYDVSSYLKKGENAIGVLLGDGWAKGRFWFSDSSADMTMKTEELGTPINLATDKYQLICELYINNEISTVSDETWKCEKSPVVRNNIYDGEVYDANLEIEGWCNPDFDDKNWKETKIISDQNKFKLTERLSPPVIVKKYLKPKSVLIENIVDIGQNIAGWVELTIDSPKNFETILEFGEIYNKGQFINENLRTANQQFRVISNGHRIRIHPHFTFYGFQYIKFSQFYKGKPIDNLIEHFNITACSIYSDLEEIGHFECGLESVNKLFSNAFWSQRDNFLDVPTDCPQRDERMGWTGDAQVFCSSAMFNMRSYSFYRKYLKDLYLLQKGSYKSLFGAVSSIVPFFGNEDVGQMSGRVGWADAATIIPFKLYEHTGKKQILIDQFESMKMWVDYVGKRVFASKKDENENVDANDDKNYGGIWKADSFHFGDWLALDGKPNSNVGGTELTYICSCYYYYSLKLFVETIRILNKPSSLEKKYKVRMMQTLNEIRDEYMSGSGRIAIQTQSAQALALYLNISTNKIAVLNNLKKLFLKSNSKIQTGFIGTPILCRAISDAGDPYYAYSIFLNESFPGWLFEVKMNSTSIWERWDSIDQNGDLKKNAGINSFNHYASGSVIEWFYRNICGIKPVSWAAGFREFLLHPQPDLRMKKAMAVVNSSMGTIKSSWQICPEKETDFCNADVDFSHFKDCNVNNENDTFSVCYKFVVPFNTVAHLKLRNVFKDEIESKKLPLSSFNNAESKNIDSSKIVFTQKGNHTVSLLKPGIYFFKTKYRQTEVPFDFRFY